MGSNPARVAMASVCKWLSSKTVVLIFAGSNPVARPKRKTIMGNQQHIIFPLDEFKKVLDVAHTQKVFATHLDIVLAAINNTINAETNVSKYLCSMAEKLREIDPIADEKAKQLLGAQDELIAATKYLRIVTDDLKKGICRKVHKV